MHRNVAQEQNDGRIEMQDFIIGRPCESVQNELEWDDFIDAIGNADEVIATQR